MGIQQRLDSLLIRSALASEARGMGFGDSGSAGAHESTPPPGVGLLMDRDRVKAIMVRAICAAEEVLGIAWDAEHGHIARRTPPFDERAHTVAILRDYAGTSNAVTAAETGEKPHVVRDLRRKHGFDSTGWRTLEPECGPVCLVCAKVLSDMESAA